MYKGKILLTSPMLWVTAFFTTFAIGGMTGVMLAIPPVDFQVHNSAFLVAHFHNVIIGGVLFGYFAGVIYWFPKVFGFRLDEKWSKRAFIFWVSGFYVAFMPLYILGLNGFMRRVEHYANVAYQPYLVCAAIGAALIFIGILLQLVMIGVSVKNRHLLRDRTGDVWDGRTLEWSVASPAPVYNFAVTPIVSERDPFWEAKLAARDEIIDPRSFDYQPIHMPKNTAVGFLIAMFLGCFGFAMVWHMWIPGIVGFVGAILTVIARTFSTETDYFISPETIRKTECAYRGAMNA